METEVLERWHWLTAAAPMMQRLSGVHALQDGQVVGAHSAGLVGQGGRGGGSQLHHFLQAGSLRH